ncbi:unnamed protein product [Phytophthora lilii]|uniref:Unnamed protein product n=1 Tax=Phytophthora lilii TaxID=2077276 RepID=A0A9W6U3D4_9STRA|nr:unnamed protein product [Phytophthora lilii]
MHSVNFPQTHDLANRIRGNISALAFWQQTGPNTLDMWGTAVMDPGGDMIRMIIVPAMVGAFMSSVKYAYCGQMKKLAWTLERRYEESKQHGAPNKKNICVTCSFPITGRRIEDFGKSNSTCKLCFGFVCHACKNVRKLSFVDPDLLLSQRKVTFCTGYITEVTCLSTTDADRAIMLSSKSHAANSKIQNSMSSTGSTSSSVFSISINHVPIRTDEVAMKGRFIVNPFPTVPLTPSDQAQLHDLATSLVKAGLERYTSFLENDKRTVDPARWKLIKSRERARVYMEKPVPGSLEDTQDLPSLLCVGTTLGQLEDMMFGVVNPTLEVMRIKASYVDDLSGAAVLATVEEPTLDEPFKSLVVKWMELDIPLHSTSLVKNRDYIYAEATDIIKLPSGERVGYHLLHSINFPQTHELPNRIRGNLSICGFFRQIATDVTEIYVTGIMDPAGGLVRHLVIPNMAAAFLSTLKYAHCGQMKKLAWMLEKRYKESRLLGAPNKKAQCVTCKASITGRKLGDFGKTDATCKLCFCYVCHGCKIQKKISFVTPDLLLTKRKVTFCGLCLAEVNKSDASDAARAQIIDNYPVNHHSSSATSETSSSS